MKRLQVETLNSHFEGHLQISLLPVHEKVNQVYFPLKRIPEIPYPRLETIAVFAWQQRAVLKAVNSASGMQKIE